jgi:iron complex transport system substrate-binding protein
MAVDRIASLLAAGTEILYALGLSDHVVAVSHECDFPDAVRNKPRVTFAHVNAGASSGAIDQEVQRRMRQGEPLYGIDVERLASLGPDLIVTQSQCDVCAVSLVDVKRAVEEVDGLRHTRIVTLNPMTLSGVFDDIFRVGQAAGCADRALPYIASLQKRVESIQSKSAGFPPEKRPRVACIEWIEPLMIAANWMPELIEIAGGRCDLAKAGTHSTYAQWSDVVAYDPEVLVLSPCGFDLERTLREAEVLRRLADWDRLSAVRQERCFAVDGNAYFNRSGPRLIDSLELLTRLLHPHLFPTAESSRDIWAGFPTR